MRFAVCVLAVLGVAACEMSQPGVAAESLSGAALEARLSDQRITLWQGGNPREATIDLRAGGTGAATLDRSMPVVWEVRGAQLCIRIDGDAVRPLDCARAAINGDRITVRWEKDGSGRPRELSGVLSPL